MSLRNLVEELVAIKLAGKMEKLEAVKMYIVDNASPSAIEKAVGIPKYTVMSTVKLLSMRTSIRNFSPYRQIFAKIVDALSDVKPIIVNGVCTLCRTEVEYNARERHVKCCHPDIVSSYATAVLAKVLNRR